MGCFSSAKEHFYRIRLLDDTELSVSTSSSSKGAHLLDQIFRHLNLVEMEFFGLRFFDQETSSTAWLDEEKTLGSQVKSPEWSLFFAVRFYAVDPDKLAEEVTRYQFFLQLRRDLRSGALPVQRDLAVQLGSLALQAETGDFDPRRGAPSSRVVVPGETERVRAAMTNLHATLSGIAPGVAEKRFLHKVKWAELYGTESHRVTGDGGVAYILGLSPTGIAVTRNETRVGNYPWPRILKLAVKKDRFELCVREGTSSSGVVAFRVSSKPAAKHLWRNAQAQKRFFTTARVENPMVAQRRSQGTSSAPERRTTPAVSPKSAPPPPDSRLSPLGDESPPVGPERILAPPPTAIVDGKPSKEEPNGEGGAASPLVGVAESVVPTGGLYTTKGDSPLSVRSSASSRAARRRPQSDSDYSAKGAAHRSRRAARPEGGDGVDEGGGGRRRRSRKKSDTSRGSRGDGEGVDEGVEGSKEGRRRRRRREEDVFVDSSTQWAAVQNRRNANNNNDEDDDDGYLAETQLLKTTPKHQRKQRSRSKSPKSSKALPPEILTHIQRDLVDPRGFSDEQLHDIPFTNVETHQRPRKISPHRSVKLQRPSRPESDSMQVAQFRLDSAGDARVAAATRAMPSERPEMAPPLRGGIGTVPTAGGGAIYFPNGIPSGYFSDSTTVNVWADDEMDLDH